MRMPGSSVATSQAEVDSLSARLNTSLRGFHVHARECRRCVDPYSIYKSPTRQLCDVGHQLAQEIALNLYNKARSAPKGMIEVTFPEGWESVDGLIRAITHKLQGEATNCIDIEAHNTFRAREAAAAPRYSSSRSEQPPSHGSAYARVQYITSGSEQGLNRGSAYARDVSHRTGESPHRYSLYREHSRRRTDHEDPRSSSFNLIEHTRRSPSPTSSRSSSGSHRRRIEEAPNQQFSSSPQAGGPRVAFNPNVETHYF